MYMCMYSALPHVHGADRRGVRDCAATVLHPLAIIFRISHVLYMGVGAGVGTLVMPECMRNAALNQLQVEFISCSSCGSAGSSLQKCPGKVLDFLPLFCTNPVMASCSFLRTFLVGRFALLMASQILIRSDSTTCGVPVMYEAQLRWVPPNLQG